MFCFNKCKAFVINPLHKFKKELKKNKKTNKQTKKTNPPPQKKTTKK